MPVVEKTKASDWSDQKWGNDHKDHFRDLIENARRQRPKRREQREDTATGEVKTGNVVDPLEAMAGAESAVLPISMALPELQFTVKGPGLAGGTATGSHLRRRWFTPALIVEQSADLTMEDQNLLALYGKRRFEEME
jgi:hypothetical protein